MNSCSKVRVWQLNLHGLDLTSKEREAIAGFGVERVAEDDQAADEDHSKGHRAP